MLPQRYLLFINWNCFILCYFYLFLYFNQIFQVAPSLHMVEVRKAKGDTLEFHKVSSCCFFAFPSIIFSFLSLFEVIIMFPRVYYSKLEKGQLLERERERERELKAGERFTISKVGFLSYQLWLSVKDFRTLICHVRINCCHPKAGCQKQPSGCSSIFLIQRPNNQNIGVDTSKLLVFFFFFCLRSFIKTSQPAWRMLFGKLRKTCKK